MNATNLVIHEINRAGWIVSRRLNDDTITFRAIRRAGGQADQTESCNNSLAEEYRAVCRLAAACGSPQLQN